MIQPINLTPYDVKVHATNATYSRFLSWATALAATGSLALAIVGYGNPWLSRLALMTSIGLGATAKISARVAQENEMILQDYRDVADSARQDVLYRAMRRPISDLETYYKHSEPKAVKAEEAKPELPAGPIVEPIKWFDWAEVARNPVDYPHLALIGKSGGGKSTLAQWLASQIGGVTIACDPHYEPGNYPTVDRIVAKGRNFSLSGVATPPTIKEVRRGDKVIIEDVPGEYPIDIRDIIDGEDCSCAQLMMAAVAEMQRRFQLMAKGEYSPSNPDTPNINLICDEFNAYSNLKGMSDLLWQLLQESRKVGIRLFLILHAKEVKALGVEGKGSIRECLSFIRLKKFAVEHCRLQVNSQANGSPFQAQWFEVYNRLSQLPRPCMIDEVPAEIPDLKFWLERNKVA